MQRRGSKVENFQCEEQRNQKNRLTPVKLESKQRAKKVIAEQEGFGREVSIECLGSSALNINFWHTLALDLKYKQ